MTDPCLLWRATGKSEVVRSIHCTYENRLQDLQMATALDFEVRFVVHTKECHADPRDLLCSARDATSPFCA